MTRILDDVGLEKMQHCLVGEMPNTYTMTKKCSENLVSHKAHSLPAGIFRPPIGKLDFFFLFEYENLRLLSRVNGLFNN